MTEAVYHHSISCFDAIAKMPKQTKKLWFDLTVQAVPDKKIQIVKTQASSKIIKPLLEAGILKPRIYDGSPIKGSYTISKDFFYCTSEPTIGEIWLAPHATNSSRDTSP